MWTISFEFRCYLLLILVAVLGVFKRRAALLCLTIVVSVAACYSGAAGLHHVALGVLRVSDSMLWFAALFLTGSCAYVFRDRIRYSLTPWLIALVLLAASMSSPILFRAGVLLAGAYVVFGIATSPALHRYAPTGADLSYGVYLYGFPVQKLLSWYVPDITPGSLYADTLLTSLTLAALSWRFIESPALRFRKGGAAARSCVLVNVAGEPRTR